MTNTFKEFKEAFGENQKERNQKLELEQYLQNWEAQSGYDEYRWFANWNGLPFRREYW